jgi:hypothetical protein
MKKFLMSLSFIFVVIPNIMAVAAGADPCLNMTQNFTGSAIDAHGMALKGTAVTILNADINTVAGSARRIARCSLSTDSEVTACLTIAKSKYNNGISVVFDIYGQDKNAWSRGTFMTSGDRGSSIFNTIDKLHAEHSSSSDGYGGSRGGFRTLLDLDKAGAVLSFQTWSGGSSLQLKQQQTFSCSISE